MPTSDEAGAGSGAVDTVVHVGAVFDGLVPAGVHPLSDPIRVEDLRAHAAAAGWAVLVADAAGGKAAVLAGLAATGAFPGWFGRNWDALSDCLVDLSWLPAEGYVVLIDGWDAFRAASPRDADIAGSVLAHAAAEWAARGTPFVALTR